MSIGDVIGVPGAGAKRACLGCSNPVPTDELGDWCERCMPIETATVEVAEVERLVVELQRARELGAALESVCAEREALLWLTLAEPSSHAEAQLLGRRIAAHLRDSGCQPPSVAWVREQRGMAP